MSHKIPSPSNLGLPHGCVCMFTFWGGGDTWNKDFNSRILALSASQGEASQGEAAEESFLNIIGWWDSAWDHCSGSSEVLLEPQANRGKR